MAWVAFEPTISVFERAKMVHALDLAATGIGYQAELRNLMSRAWVFHNTRISALRRIHKIIINLRLSAGLCSKPLQITSGGQDTFLRAEVRYEGLCDELAALLGGMNTGGPTVRAVARN
jgi:hypothetical protein